MKLSTTNLFKIRTKNENWVAKTLSKRIARGYYYIFLPAFIIFGIYSVMAYIEISHSWEQNEDLEQKIKKQIKKSKNIDNKIISVENDVKKLNGLSLNKTELANILTQLCNILKNKEVIGGYQVVTARNSEFANVIDVEIQISYGDRELLLSASNMILANAFHIKSMQKTKLGVKFELYTPYK